MTSPVPVAATRGSRWSVAAIAGCALMAAVLSVCSWVSLPFYPVPLTLQTLAVLVAAGLLGPVWGPVSVLAYLALGLAGVPVFHNGTAGPGVLFGPTGGYLLGFIPAAFVMGLAAWRARVRGSGRGKALLLLGLGAALASAIVYAAGVPWLMLVTEMSFRKAVAVGLVPFLPGDALKAVAAVGLVRAVGTALSRAGIRYY